MECPFCKKEMQNGFVYAIRGGVYWRKEKPGIFTSGFDGLELTDISFFVPGKVKSFCCEDCKKVIIDYSENA